MSKPRKKSARRSHKPKVQGPETFPDFISRMKWKLITFGVMLIALLAYRLLRTTF